MNYIMINRQNEMCY